MHKPARKEPALMLLEKGHISREEAQAAMELRADANKTAKSPIFSRHTGFDRPVLSREDMASIGQKPDAAYERLERWVKATAAYYDKRTVEVTFATIVMGRSIDAVRRDHRLGWDKALQKIRDGISVYQRLNIRDA